MRKKIGEIRRSEFQLRERQRELEQVNRQERQRIGRELHDIVGPRLSAMGFLLAAVESEIERGDKPDPTHWQTIKDQLEGVRHDLRMLSCSLLPAGLDQGDLERAVDNVLGNLERFYGMQGRLSMSDHDFLEHEQALQIYWIVYEALHNACRHGRATEAAVELSVDDKTCQVVVSDNGIGMTAVPEEKGNCLGLCLMRYRASLLDGTLSVESSPGSGTSVSLRFPVS